MTCLSLVVSEDRMVRTSALSSLQRFAVYAGNSSLSSMLRSQLDYFIDAVCLHLRSGLSAHSVQRFSSFPLPEMIQFVFKETQLGVSEFITTGRDRENSGLMSTLQAPLQLLRDLVQDTMDFVDAQASLHSLSSVGSVVSLLCVLDGFVGAIPVSTSNDSTAQREAEDNKGDSTNNPSDETHNGGHAADIDEDEQNDQDESIALEADEYSTSKHPENMQILSPLITRVVYFLSLPSPLVQQKVYRLLMLIFPRLRDSCMQDLNTNIHGVWQTLCRCLSQYVELYRIRYVGEDISKRRVVDRRRLLELRTYVEEAKRHDGVSKDYLYSLLHSLPPLLDLLELLISLSAQFIRSKLQEDVLPLIHNLLFASHYVHCKQGKQQAPGSGAQGLVLSAAFDFLLVVAERPELAPLRKQYGRLWMWLVVPFVDDKEVSAN
ncbi:hypothetical protein EON64_04310 [archaeon]|nr:MAG: hypothetical protein EON64_04310 [archaeon]